MLPARCSGPSGGLCASDLQHALFSSQQTQQPPEELGLPPEAQVAGVNMAGRGRDAVLPAWMKQGEPERWGGGAALQSREALRLKSSKLHAKPSD